MYRRYTQEIININYKKIHEINFSCANLDVKFIDKLEYTKIWEYTWNFFL